MAYVFTLRMSYVQVSVCGMFGFVRVLRAGVSVGDVHVVSLCYVMSFGCVMCSRSSVQVAVTSVVASLRACRASLGRQACETSTCHKSMISVTEMFWAPCRS